MGVEWAGGDAGGVAGEGDATGEGECVAELGREDVRRGTPSDFKTFRLGLMNETPSIASSNPKPLIVEADGPGFIASSNRMKSTTIKNKLSSNR